MGDDGVGIGAPVEEDCAVCAQCREKPGTKLCTRCKAEAYCSAECQRKAWKTHKLVCQQADTPDNVINELIRTGRLFTAREKLNSLSPPQGERLAAELEERIKVGIHSEIIEGRLRLQETPSCGLGYVAAKDIAVGEPVLFDTAFVWAPTDGKQEYQYLIAEKLIRKARNPDRRNSSTKDAQADFYRSQVEQLPLKGSIERDWLEGSAIDADMREQMFCCAIAEGCCLWCSHDTGHIALFVAAARFNHSCDPNAALESTRTTMLVRASRPIPEGAEVTVSYLPTELLDNLESRRERLQKGKGFDCTCSRCVEEGAAAAR